MPLEVIEVLSVVMTSSPEVVQNIFSFMDSKVFGSTEFDSELRFPIVYGPSLRSASVLTLHRLQWFRIISGDGLIFLKEDRDI